MSSEIAKISDVTVLITGPIFRVASDKVRIPDITFKLVSSVRKTYPTIPIVLSTWNLDERFNVFDGLLLSMPDDPGAQCVEDYISNLNRQITSVSSGIEKSKTKFVLRIRSDFLFEDFQKALELIVRVYNSNPEKIVVLDSSRHAFTSPYHVCDFLQFGPIELMERYWKKELQSSDEFLYFKTWPDYEYRRKLLPRILPHGRFPERYSPEQFLCLRYIFPFGDYPIKHRHILSLGIFMKNFKETDRNFSFIHISRVKNVGRLYNLGTEQTLRRVATILIRKLPIPFRLFVLCLFLCIKFIHSLVMETRSAARVL